MQRKLFNHKALLQKSNVCVLVSIICLCLFLPHTLSLSLHAMVRFSFLYNYSQRRIAGSFRDFFFIPTTLALFTSLFILFYIYSTSNLFSHNNHHSTSLFKLPSAFSTTPSISTTPHFHPIHNNASESSKSQSFQLGYEVTPQSQRGLPLPPQFNPKGTQKFRFFYFSFPFIRFWKKFLCGFLIVE